MNKSFKVLTAGFLLINFWTYNAMAQDRKLGNSPRKNQIQNPAFEILKKGLLKDGVVAKRMTAQKVLPAELIVGLIKYQLKNSQRPQLLKK